jgi:hypothetical protein
MTDREKLDALTRQAERWKWMAEVGVATLGQIGELMDKLGPDAVKAIMEGRAAVVPLDRGEAPHCKVIDHHDGDGAWIADIRLDKPVKPCP